MSGPKRKDRSYHRNVIPPAVLAKRRSPHEVPLAPRPRPVDEHELRTNELGAACEELVLRTLRRADRPWWLLKARRARKVEDRNGVDIVVVDVELGRLFLQVKRSQHFVEEWRARYEGDPRPIGLVVARESDDEREVFGRALGALILLRERVEGERRKVDFPSGEAAG